MTAIDGQLKQHTFYSFTLLISYMFLISLELEMVIWFFFSNFGGPNAFFPQIQQAPGPNFRKVGKSM